MFQRDRVVLEWRSDISHCRVSGVTGIGKKTEISETISFYYPRALFDSMRVLMI